jgi:hypothetical protein
VQDNGRSQLAIEDYAVLAAVLLLPWAFGGVEIWAYRSAALLLVTGASVALWKRGLLGWGLGRESRWLLPAFLLAGWGALQLVPLPPGVIRSLSPGADRLYTAAFPGYGGAATGDPREALEARALARVPEAASFAAPPEAGPQVTLPSPSCLDSGWRSLSVEPGATLERLAWYVALLLGFLVVRDRVADRSRHAAYRWALFGLFVALGLFALVQAQLWNGKIYWVRTMLVRAQPFGPYFNPTNLAGVMELAVPAMAGFAWGRLARGGRATVYEPGFGAATVGAALCLVAGFASASKLAAALLVTFLVTLALLGVRGVRARLTVAGACLVLALPAALLLPSTRLGERLGHFVARSDEAALMEGRFVVWQAGGAMLRDYPVTGAGFGTFREVFQTYVPAGAPARYSHAHNDYLELLLDGGLGAGLLVAWLAWGFARRAVRGRSGRGISHAHLGLALGVASLAVHAAFDFNHQVPANALIWVVACALLVPPQDARLQDGRT